MTMSTFWVDLSAYGLTTLVATSLLLVALGMGVRRLLNVSFALLMAAVSLWAGTSVALRAALWFDAGTQQLWMELSTLAFMLIAPLLLVFSSSYIQTKRLWPYLVAIGSLALIGLFCFPLFRHRVVANVRLGATGVVVWDRTLLGTLTSVPMLASAALALGLLWGERNRLREPYLLTAFTMLVVFGLVFSLVELPFPTLSLVMIVVIGIMGYGVLNRQLFNPLRELNERLEEQVAERTRELQEAASERQQALVGIQRHAAYLQAAAEAARYVSAIRDVDRLLQETVHLISDRFGFYHAGVFLLDTSRQHTVLRAASSEGGQRMVARGYRVRVGAAGVVGHVAGTGEARVALDVGENAVVFDDPDLPHTRSEIGLPLRVRAQVVGVLDVHSAEAAAFTDGDIAVLQILADQLAVGLENARLFEETRSSLEELGHLYRAVTVEAWDGFIGTRPDLQRYRAGAAEVSQETWASLFARARSQDQPVSVRCAEESGVQHALAVPVRLRGFPVGVLGFHRPVEAGEWQPEEIALAQGVAERMAMALENARLLEEARRRSAREQLTRQVVDGIRRSGDIEEALRATAAQLSQALQVQHVSIELGSDGVTKE